MKTVLTTLPSEAATFVRKGGIVAFPTETVYGLGADIFNEEAIQKIFAAKRRPSDNPLIAHLGNLSQLNALVTGVNKYAKKLIDAFFPGPLTLVLPKTEKVPAIATAGLDTVGVRMPRNRLAQEFLSECQTPLVAPSANLSGKPSPTTWNAVYEDLDGRIDCILKGETTEIGIESTVVDCSGDKPVILRSGSVTLDELRNVVPDLAIYRGDSEEPIKSPGLRHKHYSPRALVEIVEEGDIRGLDPIKSGFIGITDPGKKFQVARICESPTEYARELFDFFRECDRVGVETAFCEAVEEAGIGVALMDRLNRAAEG